jgi:hypothetical protein
MRLESIAEEEGEARQEAKREEADDLDQSPLPPPPEKKKDNKLSRMFPLLRRHNTKG